MCVAGLLDAMRSKLPASARIVWMCLENHADHNRKWSMSLDAIVAEVNLSIETVVRAVRLLSAHGIARGERDGPGRRATVWHMLKSYDPSPHNGGIKPEQSRQSAGLNGKETPHNAGIKQPKTPQSDGIEKQGSPQNAGIDPPQNEGISRFPPQTPPFLTHQENPPRKAPPTPPLPGGRAARQPKVRNPFIGMNPNAGGPIIDHRPEELEEFSATLGNLRLVRGSNG